MKVPIPEKADWTEWILDWAVSVVVNGTEGKVNEELPRALYEYLLEIKYAVHKEEEEEEEEEEEQEAATREREKTTTTQDKERAGKRAKNHAASGGRASNKARLEAAPLRLLLNIFSEMLEMDAGFTNTDVTVVAKALLLKHRSKHGEEEMNDDEFVALLKPIFRECITSALRPGVVREETTTTTTGAAKNAATTTGTTGTTATASGAGGAEYDAVRQKLAAEDSELRAQFDRCVAAAMEEDVQNEQEKVLFGDDEFLSAVQKVKDTMMSAKAGSAAIQALCESFPIEEAAEAAENLIEIVTIKLGDPFLEELYAFVQASGYHAPVVLPKPAETQFEKAERLKKEKRDADYQQATEAFALLQKRILEQYEAGETPTWITEDAKVRQAQMASKEPESAAEQIKRLGDAIAEEYEKEGVVRVLPKAATRGKRKRTKESTEPTADTEMTATDDDNEENEMPMTQAPLDEFAEQPLPIKAPAPKRGRGRPRKNVDALAEASPIMSPAPKRGRGRPLKNVDTLVEASPINSPAPKRKRGRPRKNVDALAEASPINSPAPKRKRGRPRKSVDTLAEASPINSPAPKRKRGRPRKVVFQDDTNDANVEEMPTRKRRAVLQQFHEDEDEDDLNERRQAEVEKKATRKIKTHLEATVRSEHLRQKDETKQQTSRETHMMPPLPITH